MRSTRSSRSSARATARTTPREKIIKRFKLDEIQTDAILELKLYRLAKLEINVIREELETKAAEAKRIQKILKSDDKLLEVIVRGELEEISKQYGTPRKTKVGGVGEEQEFDADAFIVDEDANVIVTRDGWIKRVREVKDPTATRTREGDAVTHVRPGLDQGEGHLLHQPRLVVRHQDQRYRRDHRVTAIRRRSTSSSPTANGSSRR